MICRGIRGADTCAKRSWASRRPGCGEFARPTGDLIVFVDDDNVLAPDYLREAVALGNEYPPLGAWGGRIQLQFETPPPAWTKPYWGLLAVREFTADRWANFSSGVETLPCGAGMVVRRKVALSYGRACSSDPRRASLGRRGSSLTSYEDADLGFTAYDLGLGTGLFTRLSLVHLIPSSRLAETYLLNLVEGMRYSKIIFRATRRLEVGARRRGPVRQALARVRRWFSMPPRARRFFEASARPSAARRNRRVGERLTCAKRHPKRTALLRLLATRSGASARGVECGVLADRFGNKHNWSFAPNRFAPGHRKLGPQTSTPTPNTSWLASRTTLATDLLVIAALWCGSLLLIDPVGDFPLNDDWSFGLAVRTMVEHGDFRPTGWEGMTLLTNVLWGSLFCIPVGFSFNALRASTLALSFAGILGTYFLMKSSTATVAGSHRRSNLGLQSHLLLAVEHVYDGRTLHGDHHLCSVVLASEHQDRLGPRLTHRRNAVVLATLSRQVAISVPMAFAVALVLRRGIAGPSLLARSLPSPWVLLSCWSFSIGLPRVVAAAWYNNGEGLLRAISHPRKQIGLFAWRSYVGLLYLGWFLMPVSIIVVASILRSHRTIALLVTSMCLLLVLCGAFTFGHFSRVKEVSLGTMPLSVNIISKAGIGPLLLPLSDACENMPARFWLAITILSLLGALLLLTAVGFQSMNLVLRLRPARLNDHDAACTLVLLNVAIYLLPFFVDGYFDRYLIPVMPFIAAGITQVRPVPCGSRQTERIGFRFAAVAMLAGLGVFSLLGTRDDLTWNRVRWQALNDSHAESFRQSGRY